MKIFDFIIVTTFVISSVTFAQRAGNAIQFDDIDDHIIVPHHQSLNPGTGSWSVCIWIKPPDLAQRGPLIGKRHEESDFNQYTIGVGNTDPHNPTAGKRIYINYIDTAGVSERSGYTQSEIVDGGWHHIAFVADKNTDSVYFYIDGIQQTTVISYNFGKWPDVGKLDPLYIGCNSYVSAFYEGQMDEVSMWNKALSSNQISIVMNDTLSPEYYGTVDSGLVAYYKFDRYEDLSVGSVGSDDLRDYSAWGNHGDSEGNPQLIPSEIFVGVEENIIVTSVFELEQNYPNPFNPLTILNYQLPIENYVSLKVYDVLGREVATLVNEIKQPGNYNVTWDASKMNSGVYFYRLSTGNYTEVKKMLLLK